MTSEWKEFVALVVLLIGSLGPAVPAQADDADSNTSRLDHLLQAASHLEQAGRDDLAAEIYAQIGAETEADRQRLVDARREQIRQLELEIARLQTSPAAESAGRRRSDCRPIEADRVLLGQASANRA